MTDSIEKSFLDSREPYMITFDNHRVTLKMREVLEAEEFFNWERNFKLNYAPNKHLQMLDGMMSEIKCASWLLARSFFYKDTIEGYDYWAKVATRMQNENKK